MDKIKGILNDIDKKYQNNRLYIFGMQMYKQITEHAVTDSGAMLTYYFILSFFPFVIFLISLLSYTPVASVDFLGSVTEIFPIEVSEGIVSVLSEIINSRSEALLSTSIIFATYTASKGLNGLIRAINRAYDIEEDRNSVARSILAIVFTITLAALIVVMLITIVFGKLIIDKILVFLSLNDSFLATAHLLRLVIPAISMFVILVLLYKFAPNVKVTFRSTFFGALFSTVAGIISSLGFGFYVNNFANYNLTYGSLGGIVVFLVWINLLACIIVIGAEINSALFELRKENLI